MSTTIRCKGCGVSLQMEDPKKVGYTPSLEHVYCQSCYRLFHYGEATIHFHPEDLPSLPEHAVILMISSVLHLDMLFSYPVYRYQPKASYIYIINQIDLLPSSTNLDKLLENIKERARQMHIPYEDVILMSAKNPYDIAYLKSYLKTLNAPHVYLIGVQNSGKTTLYKAITSDQHALAMKKAGLTQEALKMSFEGMMIYDMPGLYQEGYLHHTLPYAIYKNLIPDQEIKPRIYQLRDQQALCLEGLIALSFFGQNIKPVLYIDTKIKIHKTHDNRIQHLMEERKKHFRVYADHYEEKAFKIGLGKHQLTFADMGFLHIEGPVTIKVTYPKGFHLSLTEALFND